MLILFCHTFVHRLIKLIIKKSHMTAFTPIHARINNSDFRLFLKFLFLLSHCYIHLFSSFRYFLFILPSSLTHPSRLLFPFSSPSPFAVTLSLFLPSPYFPPTFSFFLIFLPFPPFSFHYLSPTLPPLSLSPSEPLLVCCKCKYREPLQRARVRT